MIVSTLTLGLYRMFVTTRRYKYMKSKNVVYLYIRQYAVASKQKTTSPGKPVTTSM